MKKLLLVLSLALTLSCFVGCDMVDINIGDIGKPEEESLPVSLEKIDNKTPYEVYSSFGESIENMADNYAVSSTYETKIESLASGIKSETSNILYTDTVIHGDNAYMKVKIVSKSENTDITSTYELFYVDGILYLNSEDSKIKLKADKETVKTVMDINKYVSTNTITELPKDWFDGVKFEYQNDGSYMMKLNINSDRTADAIKKFNIPITVGSDINNIEYSCNVDKSGNPMRFDLFASMSISMGENGTDGTESITNTKTCHATCEYSSFGSTNEITLPTDADSYTDGNLLNVTFIITKVMSYLTI